LPRSSIFMVGGRRRRRRRRNRNRKERDLNWILCSAWKKWIGGTPLEHTPYSPDHTHTHTYTHAHVTIHNSYVSCLYNFCTVCRNSQKML
jgi:hypothetical protein